MYIWKYRHMYMYVAYIFKVENRESKILFKLI